jgi:hypothetical protein
LALNKLIERDYLEKREKEEIWGAKKVIGYF